MRRSTRRDGHSRHSERASIACDNCRERRVRCRGGQPPCARCRARGLQCTFTREDLRRTESSSRGESSRTFSASAIEQEQPETSLDYTQMSNVDDTYSQSLRQGDDSEDISIVADQTDWLFSGNLGTADLSSQQSNLLNEIRQDLQNLPYLGLASQGEQLDSFFSDQRQPQPTSITAISGGNVPMSLYQADDFLLHRSLPHPRALQIFTQTFFEVYGEQFPFLGDRSIINEPMQPKSSSFLINVLCALAAIPTNTNFLPGNSIFAEGHNHIGEQLSNMMYQYMPGLVARASDDTAAAFLLISFYQLSRNESSHLQQFLEAAVAAVHKILEESTNDGQLSRNVMLLYWSIYNFCQMYSLGSEQKSLMMASDDVPLPRTVVIKDGREVPFAFAYQVRLMQICASLAEVLHTDTPQRQGVRRLEQIQRQLYDWQQHLPIELKHASNLPFPSSREHSCYIQMHIWFYHSLVLVQHALSRRRRSSQNFDNGDERLSRWAITKIVDMVVLSRAMKSNQILSCPLIYSPILNACRAERRRIEGDESVQGQMSSATSTFLQMQARDNLQLLEGIHLELKEKWKALETVFPEKE